MSLSSLSIAELQNLLMEETKKFTSTLRQGYSREEKEKMHLKIEEIVKILEEKKEKNSSPDSISENDRQG